MDKRYTRYCDFYCINAKATINQVIEQLLIKTWFVFVLGDDNEFIGIITRGDLLRRLSGDYSSVILAKDIANKNCFRTTLDTIEKDKNRLQKYSVIPVVDHDGKFLSFISKQTTNINFAEAQRFELDWWDNYYFTELYPQEPVFLYLASGKIKPIDRIRDELNISEKNAIDTFLNRLNKAIILEVGSGGCYGYMPFINNSKERVIIDPLVDKYSGLHKKHNINIPNMEDVKFYATPADEYIPELDNYADVLICQNMLDHTNEWAFVLSNLSSYVKKGGLIYLSTDIDHFFQNPLGHFNISQNPDRLFRLVENLGFDIIYKDYYLRPACTSIISLMATKR